MKKILILVLVVTNSVMYSQTPTWDWAKNGGSLGMENGNYIAADKNGDIYVTGNFNSTNVVFGSFTLTNKGLYDAFLVKYDSFGNILWAKSLGGTGTESASVVTTDTAGNVYFTGYFDSPTISVDGNTISNNSAGTNDIFIVKFNSSGVYQWGKSQGGSDNDLSYGIITDASNNVYIGGYFSSSSLVFGSTTLTNAGGDDIMVLKYDANGTEIWAKSFGNLGDDNVRGIAVDSSGNIILMGEFSSSTITFNTTTLHNNGNFDVFILKLSQDGNILWAKSYGGNRDDKSISISIDNLGNIFVTGFFLSDSITFGSYTLTGAAPENGEIWLTKLDLSGNVSWSKSNGGSLFDKGIGVVNDGNGGAYITGYFISSSLTFSTYTLNNNGVSTRDFYIAEYDENGNPEWAYGTGGVNKDFGFSLCRFDNQIYVTGKFESPSITFGSTTINNTNTSGTSDMFVSKLSNINVLDITSYDYKKSIYIYPNPSKEYINIKYPKSNKNIEKLQYSIYNSLGKLIRSDILKTDAQIKGLAKGFYFVYLKKSNKIILSKKIIIN